MAFDTSRTRTGGFYSYGLYFNRRATDIRFRPENHIRLTQSTFAETTELSLSEASNNFQIGYFTLGDILPANLTSREWDSLFSGFYLQGGFSSNRSLLGQHFYVDWIGGGRPPAAGLCTGNPTKSSTTGGTWSTPTT